MIRTIPAPSAPVRPFQRLMTVEPWPASARIGVTVGVGPLGAAAAWVGVAGGAAPAAGLVGSAGLASAFGAGVGAGGAGSPGFGVAVGPAAPQAASATG